MKFIDFFSGIGGFTRGMELAGHKCVGHCEFDKFAEASLKMLRSDIQVEIQCIEEKKSELPHPLENVLLTDGKHAEVTLFDDFAYRCI